LKPYADTSFLVSIFVKTTDTGAAFALWRQIGAAPLPINPWHRLELRNAIRRRVFTGALDHHAASSALRLLDDSMGKDFFHQPLLWTNVLRRTEALGNAHTENYGIRSADLFHLAACLENRADVLLTFDGTQARTARAAGCAVLP
jgi:predicted nucleic acid-binding protein